MPLNFVITDAGRAAIAQVGGAIGPVTLTKIAIGSAGYTPLANRTALQTEIKRLDPSGSSVPVPGTISITAQDNSADSYSVREIGLYTNNNVLFAICAQTGVIMTKGSGSSALFAMDFVMTNVPAGTVTVGNVGFTYSQATETAMGVLGIATTAEAQAGTINTKIITPLRLAEVTATESRRGVIALANATEAQALTLDTTKALTVARLVDRTATTGRAGVVVLASSTDTQNGTDTAKAVTPAGLASRTATDARAGIVELADNTETQAGTDTARAVTPAGLKSTLGGYAASSHTHGSISNAGAIGTTANLPIITGTNGVLQAGSFGTAANTFCQGNDTRLAQATSSAAGIVELADNTETQTGTDTARAVTPAGLASRTANTDRAGIVELATSAETQTGTDTARAVTPAGLASAAALFVPPGAVMPFAMNAAPSGWLAADATAVSRTTYAALFTAIGTTYGAGNGSTTFALPDLRGYFVRGSGTNADLTASGTFGQKQADAFQGHIHTNSSGGASGSFVTAVTGGGQSKTNATDSGSGNFVKGPVSGTSGSVGWTQPTISSPTDDATNGTPRTASETRPKNIALLYCIKF